MIPINSVSTQTKANPKVHSQLGSQLINPRNKQRNTKRPTHHRLLIMHTLTKPQRQITHSLRNALDLNPLIISEGMVLRRDTGVVDHGAGVGCEAGHGAAEVGVDFHDFFDGGGFEEGGLDSLFDGEDDAFGGFDSYCC